MSSEQFSDLYKFVESKMSPRDFRALVDDLAEVLFKHLHSAAPDKKKKNSPAEEGEPR